MKRTFCGIQFQRAGQNEWVSMDGTYYVWRHRRAVRKVQQLGYSFLHPYWTTEEGWQAAVRGDSRYPHVFGPTLRAAMAGLLVSCRQFDEIGEPK